MGTFVRTILIGVVGGSIYALASTGLVLTYKTSGVLNFGYGALAMFTTFVHWQLAVAWGFPVWLSALIVVLLVAPLIGLFLDTQLFGRLHGQPMIIGIIATVGLIVLLQGVVFVVWGAEGRSVPSLFPGGTVGLPGGVNIGLDDAAVFVVAASSAALLAAMFRFTRIGVAFRAVVDNRAVAGLMAINTRRISTLAWMLGTAFAALTGILVTNEFLLEPLFLPFFVIAQVFGAAIVGYLRSLPLAYAGGFGLGIAQALLIQYGPSGSFLHNLDKAVPFIIVVAAVVLAPRSERLAGLGTSFVVRTREVASHTSARARAAVAAAFFGVLALVPVAGSISWTLSITRGLALSIVFLSIVVLTGYSGQISLGHSAFMGIAAFSAAHFVSDLGIPPPLAMLLGVAAAVPAGALIGMAAVRLHGLFLALMTLAFAFVAQELFFNEPSVSGGFSGIRLPPPSLVRGDNAFFYFVMAIAIACALLAVNLRTGRTGRVLGAVRDSETAARALGINVFKYKVVIFSLSAALAGLGAILLGQLVGSVGQNDFFPFISLFYVTLAVVGGIFHVGGAFVSGLLFGVYPEVFGDVEIMRRIQFILFGLGATLALAQNPEGMFGEMRRAAAAVLRISAARRGEPPVADAAAPAAGVRR